VQKITSPQQRKAVDAYVSQAMRQTDIQREAVDKEKSGVFTGGYAINPVNGERIPIWIADYVLMTYGTGAIMAVPAHDQRDFEFARKFGLEVRVVVQRMICRLWMERRCLPPVPAYGQDGSNSGVLNRDRWKRGFRSHRRVPGGRRDGKRAINYRLRDWLISRQRYWGAPIPIIYCPEHGAVDVPDEQLPVLLPDDVGVVCPRGIPAQAAPHLEASGSAHCAPDRRCAKQTPWITFMCSSWYHLRYLSPHYSQRPFDPKEYELWMPVDTYTGGIEHAHHAPDLHPVLP